jgi:hypothetical protein
MAGGIARDDGGVKKVTFRKVVDEGDGMDESNSNNSDGAAAVAPVLSYGMAPKRGPFFCYLSVWLASVAATIVIVEWLFMSWLIKTYPRPLVPWPSWTGLVTGLLTVMGAAVAIAGFLAAVSGRSHPLVTPRQRTLAFIGGVVCAVEGILFVVALCGRVV